MDIHELPGASAITAAAEDVDGNAVTEIVEGAEDPVILTIMVDRGKGNTAKTVEAFTVELRPANPAQAADYELDPSRVTFEEVPDADGEQTATMEVELSARSDEDIGMEYLMLNLVLSGEAGKGTETSTGHILDRHRGRHHSKGFAEVGGGGLPDDQGGSRPTIPKLP